MKDATKMLMKKHGWRIDRAVHNYIYFLFYYPYVFFLYHLFRILSTYFSWVKPIRYIIRFAFARYHAKVMSFRDTKKVFELNEDVTADTEKNKRIVPYKYAYNILLKDPDFIAVMDCPCKKTMNAPEWTINSCISVGRINSRFWLERCGEKYHARKVTQQEALDLIKKFRKKGYLTQAFFKVATGGNMGVICNCHMDNCVSLQATRFARKFDSSASMAAESGYSVVHDGVKCKKCGTCERICMFHNVTVKDGVRSYKKKDCMGCELCVEHCPAQALSLYQDPDKSVPLDLDIVRAEYQRTL
ncbi:MAG TPA: 4Fe-4S dicluster domain-containing protein [Desulfomonilia bacterium]|nr:4Fe-4S dicluster domain-containing protein [Desulfomonilia bacterium]